MSRNSSVRSEVRTSTRIQRGLEERVNWWDRLLAFPLLWGVLTVVGCAWLLLPGSGGSLPDWAPGEVASFDVVVASDTTLPDEAATETLREEARAEVLAVYDLEPRLGDELAQEVRSLFSSCRGRLESESAPAPSLADLSELEIQADMLRVIESSECGEELESALLEVLGELYQGRVVDDLRGLERRGDPGVVVRNLATSSERTQRLQELATVVDLRTGVGPSLRALLLEKDAVARRWIKPTVDFLESNVAPNLVHNRAETAHRVQEAAEAVAPRSQILRRGQILVRRGDTVSPAVARTLRMMNQRREELAEYSTAAGIALLVILMVVGWWRILARFTDDSETRSQLSTVLLLMLVFVGLNRLGLFVATAVALNSHGPVMSTVEAYLWALPHAAGPAVVVLLLGMQPAVLFALCAALTAGVMLGGEFTVMVYALTSGLAGALAANQFKDRAVFTRVGVVVGGVNLCVLMVLELYLGFPTLPGVLALAAACAIAGGPLSVLIATSLLPLLEGLLGITTDMRLLELSNLNQPLLKRLSLEAPGTYQHSLAVGNLVEAGAEAVGANTLRLRVCAYYHDVGKLVKPGYFVENQRGSNPHDTLSPSMSSLVIQSHVKEGLEMARKAKLPLPVRQAIATHHGNKLIRYFFSRAKDREDPGLGEIRESDYRYPGPKPQSKELGILLLADAVEAAARTLENAIPSKMQNMIRKIFSDSLQDGQLDNTELTFSELDKMASAFLWVLTNMYHHRIDYPGFNFNRKQEKRDSGAVQMESKAVSADS